MILFYVFLSLMLAIATLFVFVPQGMERGRLISKSNLLLTASFVSLSLFLVFMLSDVSSVKGYNALQDDIKYWQSKAVKGRYPKELIDKVRGHLEKEPNDAYGWFIIGRQYLNYQQFDKAIDAFEKANNLTPKNPTILVQLATTYFYKHGNSLGTKGRQYIAQALQHYSNFPEALNLLATDSFVKKDYSAAKKYWQKIKTLYRNDADITKSIDTAIARCDEAILKAA